MVEYNVFIYKNLTLIDKCWVYLYMLYINHCWCVEIQIRHQMLVLGSLPNPWKVICQAILYEKRATTRISGVRRGCHF